MDWFAIEVVHADGRKSYRFVKNDGDDAEEYAGVVAKRFKRKVSVRRVRVIGISDEQRNRLMK